MCELLVGLGEVDRWELKSCRETAGSDDQIPWTSAVVRGVWWEGVVEGPAGR